MKKILFLVIGIIFLLIFISSCSLQKLEKKDCIINLNVLEDTFGINKQDVRILNNECSTCSPWYTPQVAEFKGIVKSNEDKEYNLFFSSSCPRHETDLRKYCISTEKKDNFYDAVKKKICNDVWSISSKGIEYSCDSEAIYEVKDIDTFIQCLGKENLLRDVKVNEGKDLCNKKCENNNDCLISCFREYVKEVRINSFEKWCDEYEIDLDNKIIFSVEENNYDSKKGGLC